MNKGIDKLNAQITSLRQGLQYADHGAYGQDVERIQRLEREVRILEFNAAYVAGISRPSTDGEVWDA